MKGPVVLAATAFVLLAGVASVPARAADGGLGACRAETMSRLRLQQSQVQVRPAPAAAGDDTGSLQWSASGGSSGTCTVAGDRLASWTINQRGRHFDAESACALEVARVIHKRPRDVEITDVQRRTAHSLTLSWESYQGQTGRCIAAENRIEKVEED